MEVIYNTLSFAPGGGFSKRSLHVFRLHHRQLRRLQGRDDRGCLHGGECAPINPLQVLFYAVYTALVGNVELGAFQRTGEGNTIILRIARIILRIGSP